MGQATQYRNIAIWEWGKEGRAAYQLLQAENPQTDFTVLSDAPRNYTGYARPLSRMRNESRPRERK